MGFKCGIVGLPNIGKSSLFNTLSAKQVPAENYPFCTIKPAQTQFSHHIYVYYNAVILALIRNKKINWKKGSQSLIKGGCIYVSHFNLNHEFKQY